MVTIKYGHNNEVKKPVSEVATTAAILRNAALKSVLGFGDNVEAHVNGSAVTGSYSLRDGDIVVLVPKANSKG